MFRRAFWFSAGAAAGVWATTKVHRKVRSLAPDSLALRAADKAVDTGHRLREFAWEVRSGMARREGELHDALGLNADPRDPAPAHRLTGRARSVGPASTRLVTGGTEDDERTRTDGVG